MARSLMATSPLPGHVMRTVTVGVDPRRHGHCVRPGAAARWLPEPDGTTAVHTPVPLAAPVSPLVGAGRHRAAARRLVREGARFHAFDTITDLDGGTSGGLHDPQIGHSEEHR